MEREGALRELGETDGRGGSNACEREREYRGESDHLGEEVVAEETVDAEDEEEGGSDDQGTG